MNKKYIWILTVGMAFTMLWLIIVQTIWINNAVSVKEQQFNQTVNTALAEIVTKIEEQETVLHISNEMVSFSTGKSSLNQQQKKKGNKLIDSIIEKGSKANIFVLTNDSIVYKIANSDSTIIDSSAQRKVISKEEFQANIVNKITDKTIFVENIVNKLIRKEINIEERLNKRSLEKIISKVLKNNGIDVNYEYSVRKQNGQYYLKSDNFNLNENQRSYSVILFPNDILSAPNYLIVYFPEQKRIILRMLPQIAFTSVLLTLIIFITFGLTLYIIFRQKKLSDVINDFINNMTHELKTPISTISLASQMLKDKSIPAELKKTDNIANIIDEESKRLGYQVEKVLQMAIVEKGGIVLKYNKLNIHDLLQNIINNFRLNVDNKNGKIDVILAANEPEVFADEVHLTNVIFNLLDNAVKYCQTIPEIEITTQNKKNGLSIFVKDNGIGISKENQKKIFDKFYRVSTGNLHDVKGFGLGLSYAKKIIQQHAGEIKIRSEITKGTTFEIFIPFKVE